MGRLIVSVAAVALFCNAASARMFRDGDRVAFFGDSITACSAHHNFIAYHHFIADYYLTRLPDADIRFFNSGRGGDGANPSRRRMAEDVAARKPTAVTMMFGMNDVGRSDYADAPTEQQIASQEARIASYAKSYDALVDETKAVCGEVALYLLTPSPFDDNRRTFYRNKAVRNHPGCNAGLGRCAAAVRDIAERKGAELVDLYTTIGEYFREERLKDPSVQFSADRVHVGSPVHLLMAMAFLEAQDADRVVSDIAIQGNRCLKSIKAEVSDVAVGEDGGVSFAVLEKSLPMTFAPEVASVTNRPEVVAFNQQMLAFYSLADGDWTLCIDGVDVATASAWEWENGINLAFNPNTPQYAQAQKVLGVMREFSSKRNLAEAVYPNLRRQVRGEMAKAGLNADSESDRAKYFGENIPKQHSWNVETWEGLRDNWERVDELMAECEAAWPEIRALAKPVMHKYVLRKCGIVKL